MSKIFEGLRKLEPELAETSAAIPEDRALEVPVLQSDALSNPTLASATILRGEDESRLAYLEQFRFLVSQLQRLRLNRNLRSLVVTSTSAREGKTLVATNLALTLARSAGRVLLIDGDLRCPRVHHMLGLPELPGFSECLRDQTSLDGGIARVEPHGVYYLPAGTGSSRSAERLQEPRTQQLLSRVLKSFDWVILDSPPLGAFADACYLAAISDAVLLVTRAGQTSGPELRQAVTLLNGHYIAGVVLNGLIVPPCDVQALSDAIIRLLQDADTRKKMGAVSYDIATKGELSWDNIAITTVNVYKAALGTRGKSVAQSIEGNDKAGTYQQCD
jgi:capsular exopolysaccharide synthesis family protein